MELNKIELKKISHDFNILSSRIMRAKFDDYNLVLRKFLAFIDRNEIIHTFVMTGDISEFDAGTEYQQVTGGCGELVFDFGPTPEEETYQIYAILKYISENNLDVSIGMISQYAGVGNKRNDVIKEFNDRVVFRLANPENGNYLENYKAMCEELTNRNSSTYGKKFCAHLNNLFENDYSVENEIYMWLPEDLVRLELKTGRNKYISIDAGSAGQRTSAILTLLLQMSKEPIIIDQPEDDLDTKNITDFIVKGINEKKQS